MAYWDKILSRGNVEDRRGMGPIGLSGSGLVGIILVAAFSLLSGADPSTTLNNVLSQLQQSQAEQQTVDPNAFAGEDSYEVFTSTVLGSTNDLWTSIFAQSDRTYQPPELVLFRSATNSSCGVASSEVGPHYCPADRTIYLDETFFDVLQSRFQAKGGDVAQAYVIAHEVGHHVQNLLGIMNGAEYRNVAERRGERQASVLLELQADCFAGVWAHSVAQQGVFEQGEFNEAVDAARAVGDDRIQKIANGRVNPESWTHGSSEQRSHWLNVGYETGRPAQCNTFGN